MAAPGKPQIPRRTDLRCLRPPQALPDRLQVSGSPGVHHLFAPIGHDADMTMSAAERHQLDRIEIALLASDPHLVARLDMPAVQRTLGRRELTSRRWQLLGPLAGVVGVGCAAAPPFSGHARSAFAALLALGGVVLAGETTRSAQRSPSTPPRTARQD